MMMRGVERLVWGAAMLALITAAARVQGARRALSVDAPTSAEVLQPHVMSGQVDGDSLDVSVEIAIEGNVFRRERSEMEMATIPVTEAPQPPEPPPSAKPRLILRGLVGGPPWNAIIEGIPGRNSGVVLSVGDTTFGFTLQRVSSGMVTVSGLDTTWKLSVERRAVGVLP